ncbi:MAG: hypothetical protein GY816_22800 [Cytophagales bacterium]|nr:hypothetical protein [Cytophagales bacterium]
MFEITDLKLERVNVMNKKKIPKNFILGVVGFTAICEFITGVVCVLNLPSRNELMFKDADDLSIKIAKNMGIDSKILTFNSPIYGSNTKFALNSWDNLYYQCTGQIPDATNKTVWTKKGGLFCHKDTYWHYASSYRIPVTDQMTPQQKAMAERFNTALTHDSVVHDPGNPKSVHNCLETMKWMAVGTVSILAIILPAYALDSI